MCSSTNHQGNANQSHRDILSHLLEWLSAKRRQMLWGFGERGTLGTVGGNVNCCSHYEKQHKLKIEPPHDPAIALLVIYLKKMKTNSKKYICTPMFMAALLTTAKLWKPKCPPMDEWI